MQVVHLTEDEVLQLPRSLLFMSVHVQSLTGHVASAHGSILHKARDLPACGRFCSVICKL